MRNAYSESLKLLLFVTRCTSNKRFILFLFSSTLKWISHFGTYIFKGMWYSRTGEAMQFSLKKKKKTPWVT